MIAWIRSKIAPPTVATQARLALLLLIAQGGITVTGSIVRVTGSGLGCDTWPLCNEGSLVPVRGATPWVHQLIEFGNRLLTFVLVAAVVAVLVACLAAYRRKEIITHVVIQGLGVIVQAIIGGISVRLDLKWWSVAIHFRSEERGCAAALPGMASLWMGGEEHSGQPGAAGPRPAKGMWGRVAHPVYVWSPSGIWHSHLPLEVSRSP